MHYFLDSECNILNIYSKLAFLTQRNRRVHWCSKCH